MLLLKLVVIVEELTVMVKELIGIVQELQLMVLLELEWLCQINISKICKQ